MNMFLATIYFAFNAVAPILLLILVGYYVKKKGILTDTFIKPANKFNFRYGLAALMYLNLYSLDKLEDIPINMAIFVLIALSVLAILGFFMSAVLTKQVNRRGVIMQAVFRSNFAIIGLPLAGALAGTAGSAMASAMQAPGIVFFNFVSVLALSLFSDVEGSFDPVKIAKSIAANPLIRALLLGLFTLWIRRYIPVDADGELVFSIQKSLPFLYTTINYLAKMSTPLALVILGAQFSFTDIKDRRKELYGSIFLRTIGTPAIGFTLTFLAAKIGFITLNPAIVGTLIALFGSPMAVSSVVMSSEMHADDVLAGQIVVWTSLISMGTIFLQTVVFRMIGLI